MNKDITRRIAAEFFGKFWLTFGGCGAAVLAAAFPSLGIASHNKTLLRRPGYLPSLARDRAPIDRLENTVRRQIDRAFSTRYGEDQMDTLFGAHIKRNA